MKKEKIKIALMSVIAAFLIIMVGWVIVSTFVGVVGDTASTGNTHNNLTSSVGATSGTVFNIAGPILAVSAVMIIVLAMSYFASSLERFNNLGKVAEFLVDSCYYFAYGLLAIVTIFVPGYLIYLLYNYAVLDGHAGDMVPMLQWVGILVVLFFAIAGLGYAFKKKLIDKYSKYKKMNEYKDNMKKLPKVN